MTDLPPSAPRAACDDLLDPNDSDPARRAELLDWLRVQAALGLRPGHACRALGEGASAGALWHSADAEGRARAAALQIDGRVWRSLIRHEVRLLPWTSPRYPERLRRLSDAPPLLAVQGDVAAFERPCLSIVGARASTTYGRRTARALAAEVASAGVCVISGLARGVDAAAHLGALDVGGVTVAVQARGPDDIYPAAHRELGGRIRTSGALLSEFAPGMEPRRPFFPLRNRIISALADAVWIVEARMRSGSLVTARHAADQGVDVLALPGPVGAPTSEGTNALLRDGARIVLDSEDLLDALGVETSAVPVPDSRSPVERAGSAVLAALGHEPATRDELGRRLSLAPELLALELAELEIAGAIESDRDGRLRPRRR
ncbi:MAG: DNA-processing protein DprA [Myxococcota bacterium]|nr:DNA-processing protein DprA [Myxococcota bacterium]